LQGCFQPGDWSARVGGALLVRPNGHTLRFCRSAFPRYDRFLGLVAGYLPKGSIVLDIGFNVGAVGAEMSHLSRELTFLCAEPSLIFRGFLLQNISTLEQSRGIEVSVVPSSIGFDKNAALVPAAATAR
jgi:hypothetical protein